MQSAHGQVVDARSGDLIVAGADEAVDQANPPAVIAQVGGRKAGRDRQAEVGQGQVTGGAGSRIENAQQAGSAGQSGQIECMPDGRRLEPIVVTGQDHRPDPGAAQFGQAGSDSPDQSAGHQVGVEQVAGDEDQVDLLRDSQRDRPLERSGTALAQDRAGLAQVHGASAEVEIRGLQESEQRGAPPAGRFDLIERPRPGWASVAGFNASEEPPCPRSPARVSGRIVTGSMASASARFRNLWYSRRANKPVCPDWDLGDGTLVARHACRTGRLTFVHGRALSWVTR